MNVRTYLSAVCIASFSFLQVACNEDENPSTSNDITTAEQASEKATEMAPGDIVSSEQVEEGEHAKWGVNIETTSGSHIVIVFEQEDGKLHHAEGGEAPFDYEVTPGGDLINFSTAKETAFEEMYEISDNLTGWDLREGDSEVWYYKFFFQVGENQEFVKINAATGDVTE